MIYGISGAHRSGKSTLAKEAAEVLNIAYIPASVTESALKYGYNAVADLKLKDRIKLQALLLEDHIDLIATASAPIIVDRTPLDMAGYMLAEFNMHSHKTASPDELQAVYEYVERCIEVTIRNYDFIFITSPLPIYVEDNTKATPAVNIAYQTHMQLLIEGAASRLTNATNYMIFRSSDHDHRMSHVIDAISERLQVIKEELKSSPYIH